MSDPTSDRIDSSELNFSCFFHYEADAILHRIMNPPGNIEDDKETAPMVRYHNDAKYNIYGALECDLLDMQFRPFQIDMVTLTAIEAEDLAISDCAIEEEIIVDDTTRQPIHTTTIPPETTTPLFNITIPSLNITLPPWFTTTPSQETTTPSQDRCHDLYILMCFAAAQVVIGSVQMFAYIIDRVISNNNVIEIEVVPEGVPANDKNDKTIDASNSALTVLGLLSWIAGIIMITIYSNAEDSGTSLPNMTPERFYNSFKTVVVLNTVLFTYGILFILTITGIVVFKFIFKGKRCKTLSTLIFSAIVMGIATIFYGCIAFYGWPHTHDGYCLIPNQ